MKKPNRKDFPNNRNGSSRYNAAVRKYNTFTKNKNKPVNTDPRPKIGNFPNREAYRQAVLKWNKRRRDKITKQKTEELKQKGLVKTSRGLKKTKTKTDLKVNKKPFAKDRVGNVNLKSKEYTEAKRINESIPINQKPKDTKPKDKGEVKTQEYKYKQVSQEELDKELAKNKKPEAKKEAPKKKTTREKFNEKFIRTKGGKLARRGSLAAKRAENREAARKRSQAAAKLRIKKKKEKK